MLVKDLIRLLENQDPDAEIILKRYDHTGYDVLDAAIPGNFKITDYGNDFFEYDFSQIMQDEFRAVCLIPFILEDELEKLEEEKNPPKSEFS